MVNVQLEKNDFHLLIIQRTSRRNICNTKKSFSTKNVKGLKTIDKDFCLNQNKSKTISYQSIRTYKIINNLPLSSIFVKKFNFSHYTCIKPISKNDHTEIII